VCVTNQVRLQGCDASVLLNTPDSERFGLPNLSLAGFEVIDAAKKALQDACPNKVSCADIVAFAARDATYLLTSNKAYFDMPAGRYDGRVSFANETLANLPGPFSDLQDLKDSFAAKGLSLRDMVTLSGAHSIGRGQCRFFLDRFADRNDAFAESLRAQCGSDGGATAPQDYVTPNALDSQYYKNVDKYVLFASDAALNSTETADQVTDFANNNQGLWESKFAKAMVKMGYIGIKTSADGEIRAECSKLN
jgi:peroxidase